MGVPVAGIVAGYTLSSSILVIINKVAVTAFPYPAILTMLQYLCSVLFVVTKAVIQPKSEGSVKGVLGDSSWFSWGTFKAFFPAALTYFICIFTNTKILQYANVETFIVFRSSTPILVAICDSLFTGRAWPSLPAFASLGVIFMGAITYMITDSAFTVRAYSWAFAYLVVITFDMIYIKHVVMHIGLPTWGLVYYNNLTAFLLSPPVLYGMGEFRGVIAQDSQAWWTQIVPIVASCLFGVAISYFGFSCRQALSPTAFTVLGVMNKLITVLVNIMIWDKHASVVGIGALLLCILGGVLYERAVKKEREAADNKEKEIKEGDKDSLPIETTVHGPSSWNERFGWRRLFRQAGKANGEYSGVEDDKLLPMSPMREEGKQEP
ncbi:nucleotide sugar transporter [Klebsormidium nitens]|uniref:Nucleotide sugar transporter n=1 Tax=Klebsormidium nitens TaxID=105231 RepID=A0A1Y1IEU4_KLENI|nr:nucleotide sugar transporter [Klebsormidium nitens]|eukprot:GAQ89444.1 nucleotide sugar transporter [Klebsormidium nitens]